MQVYYLAERYLIYSVSNIVYIIDNYTDNNTFVT